MWGSGSIEAMLQMKQLDIAALPRAYQGSNEKGAWRCESWS